MQPCRRIVLYVHGFAPAQGLELKLMEVDRENPAFTLLPERPATLGETNDPSLQQLLEYEDEETQFNLDHCGGTCPVTSTTKGPVFLRPIKICSDTEETPIKSRGPLLYVNCLFLAAMPFEFKCT